MGKIIYKVYCGKNGKYYYYRSLSKAEDLYHSMVEGNYHTSLSMITDNEEKKIKEFY